MIRSLFSQLWILSVVLCPLYCGTSSATASHANTCLSSSHACSRGHLHDGGQHLPPPCTDGCGGACICKGLLDEQDKHSSTLADFRASLGAQLGIDRPAARPSLRGDLRRYSEVHPELFPGVAIRLAIASLLI